MARRVRAFSCGRYVFRALPRYAFKSVSHDGFRDAIPFARLARRTGWDVGRAVKFLLSDYARYIIGQVLVVDGGVTLQGPERDSRDH